MRDQRSVCSRRRTVGRRCSMHLTLIVRLRRLPDKRRIAELERALAHYYEKSCRLEYPEELVIRAGKVEVVGTPKGR